MIEEEVKLTFNSVISLWKWKNNKKMDKTEWKGVNNPFEITHRKFNSHF